MMPVCGEPALARTVELCHEFRPDLPVRIITWRKECADLADIIITNPSGELGDTINTGILETHEHWAIHKMTHIILGDVSFRRGTLKRILNYSGGARAWGRMWGNPLTGKEDREIVACSFPPNYHRFLKKCCECAVRSHAPGDGDMWDIFNFQVCGTGVFGVIVERGYKWMSNEARMKYLYPFLLWYSGDLWCETGEGVTDDFEYPEHYDQYVSKITKEMLEEE
jgi:hypothetical protein